MIKFNTITKNQDIYFIVNKLIFRGYHNKIFSEISDLALNNRTVYNTLLQEAFTLYPDPPKKEPYDNQYTSSAVQEIDSTIEITKEWFIETLQSNFPKGFRLNSAIELKKLTIIIQQHFGSNCPIPTDQQLTEIVRSCGIEIEGKIFLPEKMLSPNIRTDIINVIDSYFNSGKKYVFYEAIYENNKSAFLSSLIANPYMLSLYLKHYYSNKWFFYSSYLSCNNHFEVNVDEEIASFIKTKGCAVDEKVVIEEMNNIPSKLIHKSFNQQPNILISNGQNMRFHIDNFNLSQTDLDIIKEITSKKIEKYNYIGYNELIDIVKSATPSVIENNNWISAIGIRKALNCKLKDVFCINRATISAKNDGGETSARDILIDFIKEREDYSLYEVDEIANSLGTVIGYYLKTLLKYSIRINQESFVAKDRVIFDVDAIDKSLDLFFTKDIFYMPLRDINDFSFFPTVQFSWTQRLLESYLITSSKQFMLIHGHYLNKDKICGIVVRRNMPGLKEAIKDNNEYIYLLSHALAQSTTPLTINQALDFFVNNGYIAVRRFREIEEVLAKTKLIREK